MLTALGIDQDDLARTEPLVLRDMERVCALCSQKRRCDRDLAAGTSAAHYQEYCANAPTIDGLGPVNAVRPVAWLLPEPPTDGWEANSRCLFLEILGACHITRRRASRLPLFR